MTRAKKGIFGRQIWVQSEFHRENGKRLFGHTDPSLPASECRSKIFSVMYLPQSQGGHLLGRGMWEAGQAIEGHGRPGLARLKGVDFDAQAVADCSEKRIKSTPREPRSHKTTRPISFDAATLSHVIEQCPRIHCPFLRECRRILEAPRKTGSCLLPIARVGGYRAVWCELDALRSAQAFAYLQPRNHCAGL